MDEGRGIYSVAMFQNKNPNLNFLTEDKVRIFLFFLFVWIGQCSGLSG